MLTKKEPVTGNVYIWAVPRGRYEMEADPTINSFRYELHTGSPWQSGAVRVSEHEVTLTVPAGVNLLAAALETLELKKKKAFESYAREIKQIDEQIAGLMLLSGPTTVEGDDFLEGETV